TKRAGARRSERTLRTCCRCLLEKGEHDVIYRNDVNLRQKLPATSLSLRTVTLRCSARRRRASKGDGPDGSTQTRWPIILRGPRALPTVPDCMLISRAGTSG